MHELGIGVAGGLVFALASAGAAVAFTLVGAVVDWVGLNNVLVGVTTQGVWELWMGTLALFVGLYLFGYRTALPALAARR